MPNERFERRSCFFFRLVAKDAQAGLFEFVFEGRSVPLSVGVTIGDEGIVADDRRRNSGPERLPFQTDSKITTR